MREGNLLDEKTTGKKMWFFQAVEDDQMPSCAQQLHFRRLGVEPGSVTEHGAARAFAEPKIEAAFRIAEMTGFGVDDDRTVGGALVAGHQFANDTFSLPLAQIEGRRAQAQ